MTYELAKSIGLSPFIVACVVAALLGVIEFGVFMQLPLVFLVWIYVVWIVSNYFIEIIEHKALGHSDWPVFSLETLVARRSQTGIVFFGLLLAAVAGYIALRRVGFAAFAQVALAGALMVLPAAAAVLAVKREVPAFFNPVTLLATVAGIGRAYGLCLAGAVALAALFELARARGGLHWYLVVVYALFLQAYLIGSVVYARRIELGVHTPRSPEARAFRDRAVTVAARSRALTLAYGFAAHGNLAGALKHIHAYIATDEDTLESRLWMLQELEQWEDRRAALEYAKHVLDYCERHEFLDEALRLRSRQRPAQF